MQKIQLIIYGYRSTHIAIHCAVTQLKFYDPLDINLVTSETSSWPLSWLSTEETKPNNKSNTFTGNTKILQHKMSTKNQSQVWAPFMTSGLEMKHSYSYSPRAQTGEGRLSVILSQCSSRSYRH